jgi:hypothetical protein
VTEREDSPFGGITRETFRLMTDDQRSWLIYDMFSRTCSTCQQRIQQLENRKRIDTSISSVAGAVGGALALICSKFLKWDW